MDVDVKTSRLSPPGYEAPNGDWVVACQETYNSWRVYVFWSEAEAYDYIRAHPGRWINPSAARGKRMRPDIVIR